MRYAASSLLSAFLSGVCAVPTTMLFMGADYRGAAFAGALSLGNAVAALTSR